MSVYDFVKSIRGAGGGGFVRADYWKPKVSGRQVVRLYRFNQDGQKTLFSVHVIHRLPGNKFPSPCIGDGCPVCATYERLRADPLTREQDWELRPQKVYSFMAVHMAQPDKFIIWEASEAAVKRVLPAIAKEAGWYGAWPEPDEVEDFSNKIEEAAARICGPKGMDLIMVFEPKGQGFICSSADVMRVAGKVLPFEEDDKVPNPAEKRKSMDEWRAKQAGKSEG